VKKLHRAIIYRPLPLPPLVMKVIIRSERFVAMGLAPHRLLHVTLV